jgi:hypothetical protein
MLFFHVIFLGCSFVVSRFVVGVVVSLCIIGVVVGAF